MTSEMKIDDVTGQVETASTPGSVYLADPLQGIRATKRWTWIGVLTALFSSMPARHFLVGSSLIELGVAIVVGIIIAAFAIELAFAHMFKLRKRSTYPGIILAELGRGHDVGRAAVHGLGVIQRLLGVRAAFLALRSDDDCLNLASVSGMDREAAEFILQAWMPEAQETMASQEPVPLDPAGTPPETGVSRDERVVFVPVVALQRSVGLLAVAGDRGNSDLKDEQLLSGLGVALGLSLESLRQKEDLHKSEERYRDLFENASDIVYSYTFDPPGKLTSLNKAGERVTGYKLEELSNLNLAQLVPPEYHERVLESIKKRFAGEDPTTFELEIIAKDGHRVPLEISPRLIVKDGKPLAVHAIARDITERKRAEEALRATEERLHTVVSSTPVILFAMDREGVFTLSEGRGLDALGLKSGQVVGQSVFDLYGDSPQIMESFRRALAGEEFTTVAEVGGLVFEAWYSPLRDANGEINGGIGAATDITERKRAEEALQESETKFRTLAETVAAAAFILQGTRFRYVNSAAETITGYTREEVLSMDFWDIVHPDFREALKERGLARQRGEPAPPSYETKLVTKNGEERWIDITVGMIEFEGKPATVGTAFDITEHKRAEEALRRREREFKTLAENAPDIIARFDKELRHVYVNPAVERVLEKLPQAVIGKTHAELGMPEELYSRWQASLRAVFDTGQESTIEFATPSGAHNYQSRLVPELGEDGSIESVLTITRDITERVQAEETIRHLAYHDALTGLPNRTLFEDRLTVALAQARRKKRMCAVMFLDLDRFKVVNDTVGHALGDQLLQNVAERLSGLVREGDTVARVGGDEFTLLLSEVSRAEDAVEVTERILETLRQPWVAHGHEFHVTTSIGIALYPNDGEDAQSLLRNADTAMYRAKDRGRDNYKLYTVAMNTRIAERVALESSLRHGLERGEFVVYYQPQVNINSEQVVGTEALVRWQHPERGLVLPAEFIPVAEDTGLIVPLGAWVLRAACAQNRAWQEAGLPSMRVAVNLSARQFQLRNLAETIAQVLEETGLDPQWLQLEITEGVAMQDAEFTVTMLRDLRDMGVGISIDDFGTGHSSLSYLKRFPIDVVKIGRSFVRDLTVDPNDAAIASTIISMAHNLKLGVIAEGVETEEQLAFLRERRCDEMQGFLFSKAVPAEAIVTMLTAKRRRAKARVAADSV